MYLLRLICILLLLFPGISFAAGSCSIESSTPENLTNYIKEVQSKVNEVARTPSSCGGIKDGSFSNISRFEEVIDRIDAQNPIMPDLFTDFSYNITLAVKGELYDPVIRQGLVIKKLETSIIEGLKNASFKIRPELLYLTLFFSIFFIRVYFLNVQIRRIKTIIISCFIIKNNIVVDYTLQ